MKSWIVTLAVIGVIVFVCGSLFMWGVGIANRQIMLHNQITAKQLDNTSEFDNLIKKISQVAQVSQQQMASLKEIFTSHAEARTSDSKNQIMTWIKESIPNVDTTTFNNLQNIITSSRDSWTMRQKELIDYSREEANMFSVFPGNIVLSIIGRKQAEIIVVTSGRTTEAFATGVDNDTDVFKK